MKKLVSYCGPRKPVLAPHIDEETGEQVLIPVRNEDGAPTGEFEPELVETGEFTQPDGAPIVEGWIDLTDNEIAEIEEAKAAAAAQAPEALKNDILNATQAMLDGFARTRYYDSIMSACTYVNSTNPVFAAEGTYCLQLRDDTWAKLYEMLAEVQAGTRTVPSGFEEIAGELPVTKAVWPS